MNPYCSFADVTYSAYLGLGLDATETLGLGYQNCKLYYKRHGDVLFNQRISDILPHQLTSQPSVYAVEKLP